MHVILAIFFQLNWQFTNGSQFAKRTVVLAAAYYVYLFSNDYVICLCSIRLSLIESVLWTGQLICKRFVANRGDVVSARME